VVELGITRLTGRRGRMKRVLKHELSKLLQSNTFKIAVASGCIFSVVHFVYTLYYVKWAYYDNVASTSHPIGLDNISLLYRFLGCDNFSVVGTLFYLVLPILSALPYGASLYNERKNGYQIQVIARVGKKRYLAAKFITAFLSGVIVIGTLLVFDLMLCATICPLSSVHILTLEMPMYQGCFCVNLFYNYPILFLIASILMSSIWGGVCAVLAMAAEMFIHNAVIIILFPLILLYLVSFVTEYLQGILFHIVYEYRPIFLFQAVCMNRNPAWYIAVWQIFILALSSAVYFGRGMKRENF
jgi:hypothetical protein